MKMSKFEKWLKKYQIENENELNRYLATSTNKLFSKNFDNSLMQLYIAYRNDIQTRNLVYVTWVLAGATTVLAVATIILVLFSN